jgi:hypothetical protein
MSRNKLDEVILLEDIIKLIETDTAEILPQLIIKLKQLQNDIPHWIKELEIVNNSINK